MLDILASVGKGGVFPTLARELDRAGSNPRSKQVAGVVRRTSVQLGAPVPEVAGVGERGISGGRMLVPTSVQRGRPFN